MWFGHGTAPKGIGNSPAKRSPISYQGVPVHDSEDTANLIRISESIGREARYCELPDGKIVPYIDLGDGYVAIPGDATGRSSSEGGVAAGRIIADLDQPSLQKRGGLAGGGKSGPVTSPASKILREMTMHARLRFLTQLGFKSPSVGAAIARTIPFLGILESFIAFLRSSDAYKNAPICRPIA